MTMTLNEVTARMVGWGNDRCLLDRRYLMQQNVKLGEELGETALAAANGDWNAMVDGVGDCYVVASIMCAQLGSSITLAREDRHTLAATSVVAFGMVCAAVARGQDEKALEALGDFVNILEAEARTEGINLLDAALSAWETIKDRKGRMVDGVFVREQ